MRRGLLSGVSDPMRNLALLTDLYELTMLQAYWREGLHDEAVFSLYVRDLPPGRNFLVACGLDDVLRYLETLRFTFEALDFLRTRGEFRKEFVDSLAEFRFTGDVRAVPEGTVMFANEPILEVMAPLPQAQLVESYLLNQINLQTTLASKAARIMLAARGRRVVDFGMRRMHGTDAALKGARAFYIAGVSATSNVLAGQVYGIPIAGTMAHSYIQVHGSEEAAFREFSALYPDAVLLVDTYDTIAGVRRVIELARELGEDFRFRGVRLDSGSVVELAGEARRLLDEAGLQRVQLFVSGGLDDREIRDLLDRGAPIDGFGVGTGMGVSVDAPFLEVVYKLTEYAGSGRLKLSPGKAILPGRKQIFREERDGTFGQDVIAADGETHPGRPLLEWVMRGGRRLPAADIPLAALREHAAEQVRALPEPLRSLERAEPPYPVVVSEQLRELQRELAVSLRSRSDGARQPEEELAEETTG